MATRMQYREGWKVLHKEGKKLKSAIVGHRYQVGSWTYPPKGGGPLCVFKTIQDAIRFSPSFDNIYPCLYIKSDKKAVWHAFMNSTTPAGMLSYGKDLADAVLVLPWSSVHVDRKQFGKPFKKGK